jgi:peptidoglycan/xylan/chitin deacetylase (PgdA/CDA1 family)
LSKLNPDQLVDEVTHSRSMLEARLSKKLRHFTYPFGDAGSAGSREFEMLAELGFATSTTTRKGMLFPEHAEHLQALPRVSLNGDYQQERYVRLFLSGAPFALWNRFRRLDVV